MKIPKSVTVTRDIFHCQFRINGFWYSARVKGVATAIIAGRFRAGESIDDLTFDYQMSAEEIEDALRWELWSLGARKRAVAKLVRSRRR